MTTPGGIRRWRAFGNGLARLAAVGSLVVMGAGCGEAEMSTGAERTAAPASAAPAAAAPAGEAAPTDRARADRGPGAPPSLPRKIIYNAQVSLVVDDITALGAKVDSLVKEAGGFIAETDQTKYTHTAPRAMWKVRIPVDRFTTFVGAVVRLGELQQNKVDSQDVTQEYYDTEARISNKQQEEKRLLKHLADSTGKLEDILAVERELTRVRGEVEQLQGRLKYLAAYSDMSTITISASEIRDFKPPVAPTFAAQISRTFEASVERLTEFGKGLILIAVAVAPWLPLLAVILLVAWLVARRASHVVLRQVPPRRPGGPAASTPSPPGQP